MFKSKSGLFLLPSANVINAIKAKYGIEVAPTQYKKKQAILKKNQYPKMSNTKFVNVYTKFYREIVMGKVCF